MKEMGDEMNCQTCGAPLGGGADGLCGACLFGVGMVPVEADDPGEVDLIAEQPGDVVGRYVLTEKAGEGGFGVVFRAEQQTPVRRVVAVKIIKPGMDSREVAMRFSAERQALAVMDHPHIAKVYDAGTTPRGRPFFVMEFVEGSPFTEFCELHELKIRDRLELFVKVCEAVQHAHQKGIIHRDLKPGNILVSMDVHGAVTPKVIDFGVAKAISIELTEKTFFTVFGRMVGTPQYMSPEQTDLNAVDVDTRSDIYSLGVLLYEVVTGHVPIEKERLTSANFDEMRRLIRELEPQKPSLRVANLEEKQLRDAAESRGIDEGRFRRYLSGDLDWIVMKALEKERGRRYETALGLANDVANFLEDLPVSAGPPGAGYRIGKFVRRHRVAVIAASVVLLTLLGGTIGITKGYFIVRGEKDKAETARLAETEEKNKKDYEHLKLLVEGVWNWREAQPGSRGAALKALGAVGHHDLAGIGLDEKAAAELRDNARNALFACMLWTDLELAPLWDGLESGWVPAAMDFRRERGVLGFENGRLEVRDVASGAVLAERDPEDQKIGGPLRIDSRGELVAVGFGTKAEWELVVWNWAEGKDQGASVRGVAGAFDFHPQGEGHVVGTPEGTVQLFRRDGSLQVGFDVAGQPVAIRFRPDGKALAVGLSDGGVVVIELEGGAMRSPWPDLVVTSLAWAPDGSAIAVGQQDGSVAVLDVLSEEMLTLEQRHDDPVEQVTWSHDGRLIASGSQDEIRLWDGRQKVMLSEYSAWAQTLEFSADDRTLGPVTPEDDEHGLAVLRVQRSSACQGLAGHPGEEILAAAWVMNGSILVTGAADGLRYWNKLGAALWHDPAVRVQPGGIAAAGDHLYLTEVDGIFRQELSIEGNRLRVEQAERWSDLAGGDQLVVSSDEKRIAVAHDDEVVLIDVVSGEELIGTPFEAVSSTAFVSMSPDGNWLAAGTRQGSGVRLWNLAEPGTGPIDLEVDGPATVAFFPVTVNPKTEKKLPPMLLTGDALAYRLWVLHPQAGWVQKVAHPNEMANPDGQVARMVFSPRGTVAVTCFNRKYLQILHPTELEVKSQPSFDKQWPLAMSFDGRRMATEATDGRIFIWNLEEARYELDKGGLDWPEYDAFEEDTVPLIEP